MTSRVPFLRRLAGALGAAAAVAVLTQVATALLFHATNGALSTQLQSISDFFVPSSAVLFVLVAIGALLGMFHRWFIALPAALVIAIIASLTGTVLTYVGGGNELTDEVWPAVFDTLLSNNLLFVVFAVTAIMTAGAAIWRAMVHPDPAGKARAERIALVRVPSSTLSDGELTHLERTPVDAELADTQWENYVAALEAEGFRTVEVPAADEHPDSVFVEDAVIIVGSVAVIASPGAESRRGEIIAISDAVTGLKTGLDVTSIELPGTLDGGDVLKVGSTIYVGRGGRTNAEGIRQFRAIASAQGFTVVAVPISKVLHLKSAVTALPDGTVIGFAPQVEHPELFDRFLAVPEETGSAVVVLADDAVLMSASAPLTAALIADLGYRVVTVDVSEFEKLEGCVTCLSVRIR
jgi:dimethylargininase